VIGEPLVLVSRSAAAAIFSEVRRWVEEGLRGGGSPLESLLYPLSALVPTAGLRCPVELVDGRHVRELVVDGAATPPDAIKSFSPLNCHFSAADMERANVEFNAQIDAELERRPRLGVHSKLHSHPFSGGAFLSGGDLEHGVFSPAARSWRERRGLRTAILHVVYPDEDPVASERPWELTAGGAVATGDGHRVLWRVRSWASGDDGVMHDLGDARLVPDGHPSVRAARRLPYWRTRRGARWCDGQKAALRDAGYAVSRNLLGRGWRRYLITGGSRQLLLALPPDLPAAPPRVLEVVNALRDDFRPLALPDWARPASLPRLSLVRLARHYLPSPGVALQAGEARCAAGSPVAPP
jgi:hypothetical protein